jgi:phosphoribosylanthranilate isomerase
MSYPLRVKVCGVTRPADALLAVAAGADAVGLNFYPPSPRFVDRPRAEAILRELPPLVEAVGVFTNVPLPDLAQAAAELGLRTAQWHGERPEPGDVFPCRLIPAFAARDADGLRRITDYLRRCRDLGRLPAAVLVDGHAAGLYGGTGVPAPWQLLADFDPGVPLILAGGLNPDNVAEAVRVVRPYAVDVASGVESRPGVKDAEKVRRFIENAREAADKASGRN